MYCGQHSGPCHPQCIRMHPQYMRIITRENNRKYTRKKSQVCQTILVIAHFLRHHTCDRYLRFFLVYLRFAPYLRYLFDKHTCDLNRKYVSQNRKYGGPKGPNAHISQVCQGVAHANIASMSKTKRGRITSMSRTNRKYVKDESQVCQRQITSMSKTNITSMLPDSIASMIPD